MAGKHKMISCKATIPKGMLFRNDIDIVYDGLFDGMEIVGVADVYISDQHCHAEGEEKNVRFVRIFGSKLAVHLDFMDEISLHGVYALARAIVEQWRLAFFIHKYLELLFHFYVAPEINPK